MWGQAEGSLAKQEDWREGDLFLGSVRGSGWAVQIKRSLHAPLGGEGVPVPTSQPLHVLQPHCCQTLPSPDLQSTLPACPCVAPFSAPTPAPPPPWNSASLRRPVTCVCDTLPLPALATPYAETRMKNRHEEYPGGQRFFLFCLLISRTRLFYMSPWACSRQKGGKVAGLNVMLVSRSTGRYLEGAMSN